MQIGLWIFVAVISVAIYFGKKALSRGLNRAVISRGEYAREKELTGSTLTIRTVANKEMIIDDLESRLGIATAA
jgi:hypothetical protein